MPNPDRQSLVDEVVDALSRDIQQLPPAADGWLPKTHELSERYRVSRTVVREAISRLEMQGLVEVRHGVGLRVANRLHKPVAASVSLLLPDLAQRLHQAMEARLLLEVEIARRAADRIDAAGLDELRDVQAQLRGAATAEEAIHADIEFHHIVAAHSGNQLFALMLDSIVELGRESRKLTIARTGRQFAWRMHDEILRALADHDPHAAADAMARHLHTARGDLARQLDHPHDSPTSSPQETP